ncbi:MAG: SSS family solute:Na+ symporter [Planctomycetota bacterium]|jgi:SSS family solute:Na+ symporter
MNSLGPLDLLVVLGTLLGITVLGGKLAGKQHDVRDFFLGGRRLPWWAVAASIVATEISAVTYVSLPSVVWRDGGDLTYLQIALFGSLIAKAVVGFVLVPAYFEREIFSPYDYMGQRLGEGVRRTTTMLFSLGGVLAQAARVYLVAVVLEVLMARELAWVNSVTGLSPLAAAVLLIGLVAITWTLIGGIAAIVWTDALLFLLFLVGIAVLLFSATAEIDGGLMAALREGAAAGKLRVIDTTPTIAKPYTLWVALFAAPFMLLGPYGTDQLIVQRLFACPNAREARKAMLASYVAVLVTLAVGLVGVVLYAYLRQHPPGPEAAALLAEKPDRLLPVYVLTSLPDGLRGLVVAGVFAAAISSLDSILSALAQTSSALLLKPTTDPRRALRVSRALVVGWGFVLCTVAILLAAVHDRYGSILDLALAIATYTSGALIAAFFLAFLPTGRDGRGLSWSACLSIASVLVMAWPEPTHQSKVYLGMGVLCIAWLARRCLPVFRGKVPVGREFAASLWFILGLATVVLLARFGHSVGADSDGLVSPRPIAYPWFVVVGTAVAFVFGFLLADRRSVDASDQA